MLDDAAIRDLLRGQLGREVGRIRLPGPATRGVELETVEDVTPLRAMTWIARCWDKYSNGRNFYPTKLDKIVAYARSMEAGTWEFRPDGATIDITDGIVTGGRHRLHAVLLSHKTIKCRVRHRTTIKD